MRVDWKIWKMREENKKGREEKIREIKEICGEEKKKRETESRYRPTWKEMEECVKKPTSLSTGIKSNAK